MTVADALLALAARWRALLLAAILAAAAAVLLVHPVSLDPLGLGPARTNLATATGEFLIEARGDVAARPRRDSLPLVQRAQLVAGLLGSAPVRVEVARRLRVPVSDVAIDIRGTAAGRRPAATGALVRLLRPQQRFELTVLTRQDTPVLSIYAQAPTPADARRLILALSPAVDVPLRGDLAGPLEQTKTAVRPINVGAAESVNAGTAWQAVVAAALLLFVTSASLVILATPDARTRGGGEVAA